MKRRFFWSVFFTVILRLQIYEAIAAIFWQSVSYVLQFLQFFVFWSSGLELESELLRLRKAYKRVNPPFLIAAQR